jgi:hypothetical protein
MVFAILADLALIVHAAFILFVIGGGLLVFRWPKAIWIHLPAVFWAVAVECLDWPCPLTPLENWLRMRGGGTGYHGQFIEHYLVRILYPASLTLRMQIGLAALALAVNALIYQAVLRARRRSRTLAAARKIR